MKAKKLSMHDFAEVGVDELLTIKGGYGGYEPVCGGGSYPFGQGIADGIANDITNASRAVSNGLQRGWNQAVDIAQDFYRMGSNILFNSRSPVKILPGTVPKSLPQQSVVPSNTTACN